MFTHIGKIKEGLYTASSKPCPMCNESLTIEITGAQLYAYNKGALIQEVLPDVSASDRERFLTGYCNTCWVSIFGEDTEDEDEEMEYEL